jgi:hypothetical protein
MTIYYSKNTKGFYVSEIHGDRIPEDKVEISEALYKVLLKGQSEGKVIDLDKKGKPILIDDPGPAAEELVAVNNARILKEIKDIEQTLQPRAMRDVVLYNDKTKLEELEARIVELRSQLK